jgi:2-succinyl-5-enolpyruvyl-6-hydroxy-3-cyclohexene-1-carboxylate synthase
LPAPLIVVVINNNGGGIFSFLPIAARTEVFEPYFTTPHNLQFQHAAGLFELQYTAPATREEFLKAYRRALEAVTSSLIEVVTDRNQNLAIHEEIQTRIRDAVSQGSHDGHHLE